MMRNGHCGRHQALSESDHRALARASKADPKATARDLREQLPPSVQNLSLTTIRKSLRQHGRKTYRPIASPCLNENQMDGSAAVGSRS
jgi:hypothetical protein